ncbi:MAG: DNA polymerase III subunit beta, partial [Buchnera aphidicola]|nr:DNA polymerase III subunit beta [Buchnera aphidicola]
DVELISKIHIKNEYKEGKITVSGRKMLDICRNTTKNSNIHIELKNNKIYVNSKNSNYILTTLPAKNFPKNQNFNYISKFSIHSNILKEMIEKTEFSMGKQDVRYYLNGMLLEKSGIILRIVATDGYRLAMSSSVIEK